MNNLIIDLNQFPEWQLPKLTGYEPKTNYWERFSFTDGFVLAELEPEGVEQLYKELFDEAKEKGVSHLTELVLVLNWKLHDHFHAGNKHLADVYNDLWDETARYCEDNLKGEDLKYYYQTVD